MTVDDGLDAGRGGGFFKPATSGFTGGSTEGGGGGGRPPGSFGAAGGRGGAATGGRVLSESDLYEESSRLAPVSTPPRLRSFGIPPAKRPPSWAAGDANGPSDPDTPSLLLRNLLAAAGAGTGGARPAGGFMAPGTGGAAPTGGPPELPPDFVS